MKKTTQSICILMLCALFLTSCSKESLSDESDSLNQTALVKKDYDYSALEVELLEQINIYRLGNGLSELKAMDELSIEAEDHSLYMVESGKVSHDNFTERASYLMETVGAKTVSENVAYGYRTSEAVLNAWLKSKSHRKNIEASHTHFGLSIREDADGKRYFTNIFVKK